MSTKGYGFLALVLILLALSLAVVFYFVKVGFSGSDLFWYGAIAGFFGCLFLVFITIAVYIAFKLSYKRKQETSQE